jgi:hypothetical protein
LGATRVREVQDALAAAGQPIDTNSDTEVLLRAYLAWGEACVERFNGMFAFAIYDGRSESVFAARDRFGEKAAQHFSRRAPPAAGALAQGHGTKLVEQRYWAPPAPSEERADAGISLIRCGKETSCASARRHSSNRLNQYCHRPGRRANDAGPEPWSPSP